MEILRLLPKREPGVRFQWREIKSLTLSYQGFPRHSPRFLEEGIRPRALFEDAGLPSENARLLFIFTMTAHRLFLCRSTKRVQERTCELEAWVDLSSGKQ
jgi:hypothetical protein